MRSWRQIKGLIIPRMVKTGIGVDSHRFEAGDGLVLAGVRVPYGRRLLGHSDGDVATHAIVDALLGAATQGDMGAHFPSSDPRWKGADSRVFLRQTRELLAAVAAQITHVDCTVIMQEPSIAAFIPEMRRLIAADLGIDITQVSLKATTTDGLGFSGRGEGMAAMAVATIDIPAPGQLADGK